MHASGVEALGRGVMYTTVCNTLRLSDCRASAPRQRYMVVRGMGRPVASGNSYLTLHSVWGNVTKTSFCRQDKNTVSL